MMMMTMPMKMRMMRIRRMRMILSFSFKVFLKISGLKSYGASYGRFIATSYFDGFDLLSQSVFLP